MAIEAFAFLTAASRERPQNLRDIEPASRDRGPPPTRPLPFAASFGPAFGGKQTERAGETYWIVENDRSATPPNGFETMRNQNHGSPVTVCSV
jgi:hypothetical protein